MVLPFRLVSLQGAWFSCSLLVVLCGSLHFGTVLLGGALGRLFPARAAAFAAAMRLLYTATLTTACGSYVVTLVATTGNWWQRATHTKSPRLCFVLLLCLSDMVHYIVHSTMFLTCTAELYWTFCLSTTHLDLLLTINNCLMMMSDGGGFTVYYPEFVYALLNALPIVIESVPLPSGVVQQLRAVVAQQDRIYQRAVQLEALTPVLLLAVFVLLNRSARLLHVVFLYVMVFLRARYLTNYATHGLLCSVSCAVRQALGCIPPLQRAYNAVMAVFANAMPDGVCTPDTIVDFVNNAPPQNAHSKGTGRATASSAR